jgi:hypothetical protein
MNIQVNDFYPMLKSAVAEARAAGLEASALKLEERAFSAYTTSSELLAETGEAILEFQKAEGTAIPPLVAAKLKRCLNEIRKVWPGF